ncbi:MAG: PaaI family thioesterase [Ectothiorhodospiraceae bacterium]|nr:PaaI family thioesterase [Ectothiorhodospiraceae bacterium]
MQVSDPHYKKRVGSIINGARFIRSLGLVLDDCGPGWCLTRLTVEGRHLQQDNFIHAGVQGTMADHTAGCAGLTLVEADRTVLTIEFKLNLLRPAVGEELTCRAEVLRPGRSVIVAESWIHTGAGDAARLCAKATVTLAVVPIP